MRSAELFFVGPWDLDRRLPCVPDDPDRGRIVFVESVAKGSALPYHRQKLVLVLSAMHHFADELQAEGFDVTIVNAATYVDGLRAQVEITGASRIHAMMPREWGVARSLVTAAADGYLGAELRLHDDGGDDAHFLLPRSAFAEWARGRKTLRMHHFYGWMRKRTGWLMEDGEPVGGKLSYDEKNRKPAKGLSPPDLLAHEPDELTTRIMERVSGWQGRWGSVDGFAWPVTRSAALEELDDFFARRAADFGPYQDAMLEGERFLWHARISAALNLGLLRPREIAERIQSAYDAGDMPLSSAEGLLRQIIGWREYVRGIYWLQMPELRDANLLEASRPLPKFYWEPSRTDMRCVQQAAGQVLATGYAHHIQRLMVLGNFALLAGVDPVAISHWFWAGFVDAYEWVELPNVHGMAVFATDVMTTKPYAASGNYIRKMSDHCGACRFDVEARTGPDACPFNPLYWHFMARHRERLSSNPRIGMLYRTWDRFDDDEQRAILETAETFLDGVEPADHGWTFDDDAG